MIPAQEIVNQFQRQGSNSLLRTDPIRILEAIVVGIDFQGAGRIVQHKHEGVEGLTTTVTIHLTAGIGVATAVNRVELALLVTAIVLVVLGYIELRIATSNQQEQDA